MRHPPSDDPGSGPRRLTILHEDAHCLAIDKPAGLLSQARQPGDASLEAEVRRHLCPSDPTRIYLGIVHRLDRPVSGVILWAKNPKAARRLAEQFAARRTLKEYQALVSPPMDIDQGIFEDWLHDGDMTLGRVNVCQPGTPRSRWAVTRFQRRADHAAPERTGVLTLWPETGRTHQLRVQCSSRGHPIVGDDRYGSTATFPSGIALHAARLSFRHPTTGVAMTVSAGLPPSWLEAGVTEIIRR